MLMADIQLDSGLWVPQHVVDVKSDRIAKAEFPRGTVDQFTAVSRFRDFHSYLKAIKVPWVWPCLSVIMYNFAASRWGLVEHHDDDIDPDETDPFVQLLQKPNPQQTGFGFLELAIAYLELTGNVYITTEEVDGSGQPRELYLPNPARMRILPGPDGVQGYIYDASPSGNSGSLGNGALIPYDPDEVIHIKYPALLDGYHGVGNVEASEILVNIVSAMAQQEFSYWDSGGRIIGVLETDRRLSDQDFYRLKRDWQLASADRKQRMRTAILEQGLKYTPIAEGMRSLDLVAIDKNKRDQMLAVFGVPLPKLGIMEMAQYKMDEADAMFWQEKMHPLFDRWEDGIQTLVDRFSPQRQWRFERHTFEDDAYKLQNAATLVTTPLGTVDEGRAMIGLPPLPNGNGQVLLIPSGLTPVHITDLGILAEQTTAPPEPAPGPMGPADDGAPPDEGDAPPDNLVHLTDHLPQADAASIVGTIAYWRQVQSERKAAAARVRARPRPATPMSRAAKLYRPRDPG